MDIQYTTTGGHIRYVRDVVSLGVSANKQYVTYKAVNGKTYDLWEQNVHNGVLVADAITVRTPSNWARFLGNETKYINN